MRVMEILIKHSFFALLIVFAFVLVIHAQDDQSGFISLDCGLPESSGNYSEPNTGINYISDKPFINTGVSKTILPEYQTGYQKQLAHLRAFPEGIRNCYTVNITRGTSYLIRATFYYGNYDNKSYPPGFDIHLGANFWDTIIFYFDLPLQKEIIHVPLDDYVRVCLVNNGTGTPFISALELRPLVNMTYVTQSGSLSLSTRVDLGSITNRSYRYPFDVLDRGWSYWDINNYKPNWTTISTPLAVNSSRYYKLPSKVMSTAITPTNASEPLVYTLFVYDKKAYYAYLHFSEIQKLKANQSRSFDVFLNGELFYGPVVPGYLKVNTIYSTSPLPVITNAFGSGNYTFSLIKRENSTLPPILNAIEIYTLVDFSQSETNLDDVQAITMIKSTYEVLMKRNWDGDPCAPIKYLWEGLNCSYDGSNPPRITSLNLSSSGLTGEITSYMSKLTMLQSLDLSNNSLTGPVHKFLAQLPNLKVLNLERNNLMVGSIPAELIAKSKNGSLSLSIDTTSEGENIDKCTSSPCERKKKSNILIPIVSSVGGLALLLLAAVGILIAIRRNKKQVPPGVATIGTGGSKIQNGLFEDKKRQFTYSEVLSITNNFVRVLGSGGFGTVYHGFIGDTQVAVKKLSHSSVQGYQQFQAEVKLLMTVHHRNLTSLIGYCIDGNDMALLYEYMTNGDLDSHLDEGNANVLSWERRLQIALDAAQGLEYLHNGCKPPIVHRDVKTTNILLNENFQAKLADFGLSRAFPADGGSHVSTVVAGTPGYLDPEYSTTNRLTEKSDVYSFGVVLLQIITCRSAILSRGHERTHISQWVRSMLDTGDIESIIDKRLRGDFETNSVWKAVEIAIACVSQESSKRPNMSRVVTELKEGLALELARRNHSRATDSTNSIGVLSTHMTSVLGPLAR